LHGYDATDGAVAIGNDTEYSLYAYVRGGDLVEAQAGSSRSRFGQVKLNCAPGDLMAPFGGYEMSGNGRERGNYSFAEFRDRKAIIGFAPKRTAGAEI
jgi:aldehyde dehydrogenase (NAD+)